MGGTKLGGANWEASAYGNDYTNFGISVNIQNFKYSEQPEPQSQ